MHLGALDDLDDPAARALRGQSRTRSLITGIGEDFQDERPHGPSGFRENQAGTIAVLDIGRMNGNAQEQAERVDKQMPFAPEDFLARIVALRIERSPPFGAPLALWLSMMAAVGLASRPSRSRRVT